MVKVTKQRSEGKQKEAYWHFSTGVGYF